MKFEKAIETIGEDRIKKYYFGVNEMEENKSVELEKEGGKTC